LGEYYNRIKAIGRKTIAKLKELIELSEIRKGFFIFFFAKKNHHELLDFTNSPSYKDRSKLIK